MRKVTIKSRIEREIQSMRVLGGKLPLFNEIITPRDSLLLMLSRDLSFEDVFSLSTWVRNEPGKIKELWKITNRRMNYTRVNSTGEDIRKNAISILTMYGLREDINTVKRLLSHRQMDIASKTAVT